MLESLGIGAAAAAVYQEMLKDTSAGVTEIGSRLGWNEERVRAGLDELARLSLVRPSWEDPSAFRAVEPEVGLASLLAGQEAELRRRQEEINAGKQALELLVSEYGHLNRSRRSLDVERLDGIDAVRLRIESLSVNCTTEIMGFVSPGAQSAASLDASRPLDLATLQRGVRMRTVYLESVRNDAPSMDYTRWLVRTGAQVRTAPILPPRMVIYDQETAVTPVDPEVTRAGAYIIKCRGIVTSLCELFEQVWRSAEPLEKSDDGQNEHGLSAQEQAVLHLLAKGHTDEVVARKLGVSVRTGRRITATLATRLGAKSRFQAGAMAVARGWIDPTTAD
ncbi:LuxR C-terminal-related transcriptional regulator [Streptomyces sp. S.PNR 29]|uniref:LuxR C-terminal-related transcriptional regulator n=1 Tax=Streptomyces sp. S.PNR 29 TaxID=2973805 RepID=UPI0025B1E8E9|nr:LuxR C-terminal-related transcriptional regulator [Streptomyces sp. S.PNR 29]MDN0198678.1 LuxR C-terminal-related transcriptional regulator [Streptomyces sp. S.PNR 29]